jgi:FMN phosphatase YigB (HAD superfamily)
MMRPGSLVFLIDVDNTLLDNDRFGADVSERLEQAFGSDQRKRYWSIYGALRDKEGVADYLGALQMFREGLDGEPELLQMSAFLLEYPFAERLYPGALDVLDHLSELGVPVILSDGDIVFQPRKIQRSGLWDAVDGRVLITVHKERSLDMVERHFPAAHYVMIDDKPTLLSAMKRVLDARLTTVFVQQGHYAAESVGLAIDPPPDRVVARIGDLAGSAAADFGL